MFGGIIAALQSSRCTVLLISTVVPLDLLCSALLAGSEWPDKDAECDVKERHVIHPSVGCDGVLQVRTAVIQRLLKPL